MQHMYWKVDDMSDIYVYLDNDNKIAGITDNDTYANILAKSKCNVVKLNKKLKSNIDLESIDVKLDIVEMYGSVMTCDEECLVIDAIHDFIYHLQELTNQVIELSRYIKVKSKYNIFDMCGKILEDYSCEADEDLTANTLQMDLLVEYLLRRVRDGN